MELLWTICFSSEALLARLALLGDCMIVLLFTFVELLTHSLTPGLMCGTFGPHGGVNLPDDLNWRRGEDLGDIVQGA